MNISPETLARLGQRVSDFCVEMGVSETGLSGPAADVLEDYHNFFGRPIKKGAPGTITISGRLVSRSAVELATQIKQLSKLDSANDAPLNLPSLAKRNASRPGKASSVAKRRAATKAAHKSRKAQRKAGAA